MDAEYLNEIAKLVEGKLPEGMGFAVFAFPFGGVGDERNLFYMSNCERDHVAHLVEEWSKLEREKRIG